MKIKHKKHSIHFIGAGISIKYPTFLFAYITCSILITILFPSLLPLLIIPIIPILAFREKINFNINAEKLYITPNGIKLSNGSKTKKIIRSENIHTLYAQDKYGQLEFYINNKEEPLFNILLKSNAHSIIQKMTKILKLEMSNAQKTASGKIYKFVSKKIIEQEKNYQQLVESTDQKHITPKSIYYKIKKENELFTVVNENIVGDLGLNKLIVDHESHSLKIHLTQSIPDELSIYDIEDIEVRIHQNNTGDPYDLILGKLVAVTNSGEEITIYRCEVIESHQFDFTSDEFKKYLVALKAMINFEIFSILDRNAEHLDFNTLNENLEKQKDILPNRDELTS